MPEASQNVFDTQGASKRGTAGATVFLKSAFFVILVIFFQTWAEIDARIINKIRQKNCQKIVKKFVEEIVKKIVKKFVKKNIQNVIISSVVGPRPPYEDN